MIKRELYLSKLRDFYNSNLIKVIYGVRRSGKSEILKQIKDELIQLGVPNHHVIYLNFEDLNNIGYLDAIALNDYINTLIVDQEMYYLLFDEIQMVIDFERVINSLKATKNCSIFITGSNATLLSGELATLLSGRYVSIKVMPFTYSEVVALLKLQGKEINDHTFLDYLKWGGMPQRFELSTEQSVRIYLEDVLNSIIYKDILSNEKKVDKNITNKIIQYLFENTGKIFSDNSVYTQLKDTTINLQKPKVYDIVSRIINAMAVNKCSRYDIQGKQTLSLFEKYYAVDLGLRTAMNMNASSNYGASLETLLYNEFIARGYEVYVGKTYKGEVDFMILHEGSRVYVQVCYKLDHEETRNREFNAFLPILDSYPKYVVSMDHEDYSQDGIRHIHVIDLLLGKKNFEF